MFSAFMLSTNIMIYEVECNINTNVLIPTHRSWRHSLSASLEDRAHGGIRPRCCTNPRTMERWATATTAIQLEESLWLKSQRANHAVIFLYVGRWMTVWPMGCRDCARQGRYRRINLEQARALLQQEYGFTDVSNDQCENWGAVRSKQEWQPSWSMGFESVVCHLFKLSRFIMKSSPLCGMTEIALNQWGVVLNIPYYISTGLLVSC